MSDPNNPATTPAASGVTRADLEALLKPVMETVSGLANGFKSLSEGHKSLQESVTKASSGLKAEDVASLVAKQLAEHQSKAQQESAQATAKAEVRKSVIAAKLPGVPESVLKNLPDTADKAQLEAAADALRKDLETAFKFKPADVGGAASNGGGTPAGTVEGGAKPKYDSGNSNLTPGQAAWANSLQLPARK